MMYSNYKVWVSTKCCNCDSLACQVEMLNVRELNLILSKLDSEESEGRPLPVNLKDCIYCGGMVKLVGVSSEAH